jgi:hypothetical protein
MLLKNANRVMDLLAPSDKVLDIGGWAHPFNRANWIIDLGSFETRGYYNRTFAKNNPYPPIGGDVEYFTKQTWIQRDICSHDAYPFRNKELDFVVCSHTLEDIRDPLWVCSEMIRISKAGYIEVPSRLWESCRGHEPKIAGLSHHRWLIEIEGDAIQFLQKFHSIHRRRHSLPARILKSLDEDRAVTWLFWKDSFSYREGVLHGEEQTRELQRFARLHYIYPNWLGWTEDSLRMNLIRFGNLKRRLAGG